MLKRKGNSSWTLNYLAILSIVALLLVSRLPHAEAADNGWDAALSSIDKLHDSFTALDMANKEMREQTKVLRKQNTDKLKEIHSQLKLIDKDKLDRLKSEADHAQKKYAPLLAEYTDLGKKAADARKRKDRKSAVMFDLKRNRIKASANAARQEIKLKRDALTAAKKLASAKVKAVKEVLVPVQALKKQITAENKKISDYNKNRIASDKRYKSAVKLGDAFMAAAELRQIVGYLGSVQSSQKSIYEWESSIRKTIQAADAKLPR